MNPQPKAQLGKRYSDFSASMQERTLTNIADRIISMPIDHAAFLNRGHTFVVEEPLDFWRDPDLEKVILAWISSGLFQGHVIETPVSLILTDQAAKALLADLPRLQALLAEATIAPPKPDVVQ